MQWRNRRTGSPAPQDARVGQNGRRRKSPLRTTVVLARTQAPHYRPGLLSGPFAVAVPRNVRSAPSCPYGGFELSGWRPSGVQPYGDINDDTHVDRRDSSRGNPGGRCQRQPAGRFRLRNQPEIATEGKTSTSQRSPGSNRRCRRHSSTMAETGTASSPSTKSIPTTTVSRSRTAKNCSSRKRRRPKPKRRISRSADDAESDESGASEPEPVETLDDEPGDSSEAAGDDGPDDGPPDDKAAGDSTGDSTRDSAGDSTGDSAGADAGADEAGQGRSRRRTRGGQIRGWRRSAAPQPGPRIPRRPGGPERRYGGRRRDRGYRRAPPPPAAPLSHPGGHLPPADHPGPGRQGGARQQGRRDHQLYFAGGALLRADAEHAARRRHLAENLEYGRPQAPEENPRRFRDSPTAWP